MKQQLLCYQQALMHTYRNAIETAHSGLQRMGAQRLYAVTAAGFGIKVVASLLALAFTILLNETSLY
jgi:hypothetical protein